MNAECTIPAGGLIAVRSAAYAAGRTEEVMASLVRLVSWGAGGHAKVVADIMSLRGEYSSPACWTTLHPDRVPESSSGLRSTTAFGVLGRLHSTEVRFLIPGLQRLLCAARTERDHTRCRTPRTASRAC
jgi:hypothetical protein